ncbi:MAG: hypothetical protein Kow00103_13680 [Candidatus Caldatribacteriota bacterium]
MVKANRKIDINKNVSLPEYCFYLHSGQRLKNIAELMESLKNMDQDLFFYHANERNNDFANWINDVFGEKELARRMRLTRHPSSMFKSIEKYLQQ